MFACFCFTGQWQGAKRGALAVHILKALISTGRPTLFHRAAARWVTHTVSHWGAPLY